LAGQQALDVLAAGEGIEAGIRGDLVQPRAKRSAFLEAAEATPGAQIGLLHEIFGFVHRTKHAVTMQFEFAAEGLGEPLKHLVCTP